MRVEEQLSPVKYRLGDWRYARNMKKVNERVLSSVGGGNPFIKNGTTVTTWSCLTERTTTKWEQTSFYIACLQQRLHFSIGEVHLELPPKRGYASQIWSQPSLVHVMEREKKERGGTIQRQSSHESKGYDLLVWSPERGAVFLLIFVRGGGHLSGNSTCSTESPEKIQGKGKKNGSINGQRGPWVAHWGGNLQGFLPDRGGWNQYERGRAEEKSQEKKLPNSSQRRVVGGMRNPRSFRKERGRCGEEKKKLGSLPKNALLPADTKKKGKTGKDYKIPTSGREREIVSVDFFQCCTTSLESCHWREDKWGDEEDPWINLAKNLCFTISMTH